MRRTKRPPSGLTIDPQPKATPSRAKQRRSAVRGSLKSSGSKEIAIFEGDLTTKEIALYEAAKNEPEKKEPDKPEPDLRSIVHFRTSPGHSWKEVTTALNVSRSGASFLLKRPCEIGCLVAMVIAMPTDLRAYDLNAEFYPVIGLIQYCHERQTDSGTPLYSVGVAFVGKDFPPGWDFNPTQNYYISGTTSSGLWKIRPSVGTFKVRGATRFWITLDITVSLIQKQKTPDYKQETVTCNVSATGALVVCSLDVAIGQKVKFASKEKEFYSICIVRDRQLRPGKLPLLHLEFIDNKFPVEKIAPPKVTAVTA